MGLFKKKKYADLTQSQPQPQPVQNPNFVRELNPQVPVTQQLPTIQPHPVSDPCRDVLIKLSEHLVKLNEYILSELKRL